MAFKQILNVPLNRVEGDLEIRVELRRGVVAEAWSAGVMYRGFENLLVGRAALDSLVITPRICGICSTAHLLAAAAALDQMAAGAPQVVPDNAQRVRNLALMVEFLQSDMRQGLVMFTADFANPAYRAHPLFDQAVQRYTPFKGDSVIEVIQATRKILEMLALLGGQWPHSSFIVPGGVVSVPTPHDLAQCRYLLAAFRRWYERRVLGCCLERWLAVANAGELDEWLDEAEAHRQGDLGFFIRFARLAGLHRIGKGHGNFISFGGLELPGGTAVRPLQATATSGRFIPAGFVAGAHRQALDLEKIVEHVAYSWFVNYGGGRHPFGGETRPDRPDLPPAGDNRYSWAKAPRYGSAPAETGPLAELIVANHPLFSDLVNPAGPNVLVRQLARLARPALLIPAMETWLQEITAQPGPFYRSPASLENGQGVGLLNASRGALGHWVKLQAGKIAHYQIITPTAWNGSPRDAYDTRGPWEEALIGIEVHDPDNPVELGHVIRSFDPCLVCSVH